LRRWGTLAKLHSQMIYWNAYNPGMLHPVARHG
jgi:hypothetical protein